MAIRHKHALIIELLGELYLNMNGLFLSTRTSVIVAIFLFPTPPLWFFSENHRAISQDATFYTENPRIGYRVSVRSNLPNVVAQNAAW